MTLQPENPSQTHSPAPGSVVLIGAGPGEAGLITVAGLEAISRADAVVYDALANPALLGHAPPHAQLIDAGKRAKEHRLTQDQTNALLLRLAREGKRVVRLKGGDPYLFGRGAEEVAYLTRGGVACTVIPGITAGIAAPMYAGIPVTHRDHASSVTFVTAHEDPTKPHSAVDYAALAALIGKGGTACFYMGVGRLSALAQALVGAGLPSATPAAAIQWGTTPRQRSVRSDLARIAEAVAAAQLGAPAIIVVGAVAAIDEPGLSFFESRPLFASTVLVTRTRQQASDLSRLLGDAGARVLEAPTIRIVPPQTFDQLDAALSALPRPDWLIITSANAVTVIGQRLDAMGIDARALAGVKIAAVGPSTAAALKQQLGLRADLLPDQSNGPALARAMIESRTVLGRRCVMIRGDLSGDELPRMLIEAGAQVSEAVAYQTQLVDALPEDALRALRERRVDWLTFTSSSCARNLIELLGSERDLLDGVATASIGPMTSATMRELGLGVTVESPVAGVEALAQAIIAAQLHPGVPADV